MKKALKVSVIIFGIILALIIGVVIFVSVDVNSAVKKQVNNDIDMSTVADGKYTGESDGGIVYAKVEVTVKEHKIENIEILEHRNGRGKSAEDEINDMIEKNTDDVDVVSGATVSSKTIRNAVNNALSKGVQ